MYCCDINYFDARGTSVVFREWDSHGEGGEDGVFNQQGHRHRLHVTLLTETEETTFITTLCNTASVIFTVR